MISEKYKKLYEMFIAKCRVRRDIRSDFFEIHHILPLCLGGDDSEHNIIKLTPREHYFAHLLLCKITVGTEHTEMRKTVQRMASVLRYKSRVTSKNYEQAKEVIYKILQAEGKEYSRETYLQTKIFSEYTDIDKVLERGACKICGIRPKAINYVKQGRVFYRSKCDVCLSGKNKFKIPQWKKEKYLKKSSCERCGFTAKFSEQLAVVSDNRKYKTVCLNCQMELTLNHRTNILRPVADY